MSQFEILKANDKLCQVRVGDGDIPTLVGWLDELYDKSLSSNRDLIMIIRNATEPSLNFNIKVATASIPGSTKFSFSKELGEFEKLGIPSYATRLYDAQKDFNVYKWRYYQVDELTEEIFDSEFFIPYEFDFNKTYHTGDTIKSGNYIKGWNSDVVFIDDYEPIFNSDDAWGVSSSSTQSNGDSSATNSVSHQVMESIRSIKNFENDFSRITFMPTRVLPMKFEVKNDSNDGDSNTAFKFKNTLFSIRNPFKRSSST